MELGSQAMIFLTGKGNGWWVDQALAAAHGMLGLMLTPQYGRRAALLAKYPVFAIDNGCYTLGDKFDLCRYLDWIDTFKPMQAKCLFAVAPDVVGNAELTWKRSKEVLPQIQARGYRAALVAQDGLEALPVPWACFDVLFVGGTTAWKLSEAACRLIAEAKAHGKWCHMGRVNSRRRLRFAAIAGCDSVDGTLIAFGPDKRWRQLVGWLQELCRQPVLKCS